MILVFFFLTWDCQEVISYRQLGCALGQVAVNGSKYTCIDCPL